MDRINFLFSFLKFQLVAGDLHAVHSPFLFEWYGALRSKKHYYDFDKIEELRQALLLVDEKIEVVDFGAGSKFQDKKTRKVSDIAKYAEKPMEQAQAIFELTHNARPRTIIELGTSLGLTTAYLASVNSKTAIFTFEGCPNTLSIAKNNLKRLGKSNVNFIEGNFDQTIPAFLENQPEVDVVFFDGNHTFEATKRYFEWFIPHVHNDTIFIFDDIHWSKGMERAWDLIQSNPKTITTIDFFHFGVVFFKKELSKEHFKLKL